MVSTAGSYPATHSGNDSGNTTDNHPPPTPPRPPFRQGKGAGGEVKEAERMRPLITTVNTAPVTPTTSGGKQVGMDACRLPARNRQQFRQEIGKKSARSPARNRQDFRQCHRPLLATHLAARPLPSKGRWQGVRSSTIPARNRQQFRQDLRQHFWFIDAHRPRVVHIQKYACAYNVVRRHTIQQLRSANTASHDM